MNEEHSDFIRLKPEISPGYDIDRTRPLRAKKRQSMYPLLVRARQGYAGEFVLGANPAAMKTLPNADGIALGFGFLVVAAILCAGVSSLLFVLAGTLIDDLFDPASNRVMSTLFLTFMMALFGLVFAAGLIGCFRVFVKKEFARPTVFNRRTGRVVQLQGTQRVEANWDDLRPYIEQVRTAHASGGSLVENFLLVEVEDGGRRARNLIEIKMHAGSAKIAAMYYRFLCDYMEGNWKDLPEIFLLGGIRLPLWREFRQHRMSFWFATRDWADRSRESRIWMWILVPAWTAGWWPLYIVTFIGGRLGWVPQLSEEDLLGTDWNESTDGPVPEDFASKVSTRTLHPEEKRLYIASFVLASALWTWFSYVFVVRHLLS